MDASRLPTRVNKACDRCRRNKSRCDQYRPCSLCRRADADCVTSLADSVERNNVNEPPPAKRRKRRRSASNGPPDGNDSSAQDNLPPNPLHGATAHGFLTNALPTKEAVMDLVQEYFDSVHWFSLVVYEPTFRASLNNICEHRPQRAQRPFLLLLSTVLGLAAWYRSQKPGNEQGGGSVNWKDWSSKLIANAQSQILDIMDDRSLTAIQTLTLLGSFYVYHGRPNLSFALLGATVRAAQAAGIHKHTPRASPDAVQERSRVWWTIYTWDRFASITYGRPLSINDKDCSAPMPGDIYENPVFDRDATGAESRLCFSKYQRELNQLYIIASPAIDRMFRVREARTPIGVQNYLNLVDDVTTKMRQWWQRLPEIFCRCMDQDYSASLTAVERAYKLQALSLCLTYDSILIIILCPFWEKQLNILQNHAGGGLGVVGLEEENSREPTPRSRDSDSVGPMNMSSRGQWWEAASRTCMLTELPQLAELASFSHLSAFMAINLYNAAVVLVVVSLSEPFSTRAQQAKQSIGRVYRLQQSLGGRVKLAQKSAQVLRKLVILLLRHEGDAILKPSVVPTERTTPQVEPSVPASQVSLRNALNVHHTSANISHGEQMGSVPGSWANAYNLEDSLACVQQAIHSSPPDAWIFDTPRDVTSAPTSQPGVLQVQDPTVPPHWADANYYDDSVFSGWAGEQEDAVNDMHWLWDNVPIDQNF